MKTDKTYNIVIEFDSYIKDDDRLSFVDVTPDQAFEYFKGWLGSRNMDIKTYGEVIEIDGTTFAIPIPIHKFADFIKEKN